MTFIRPGPPHVQPGLCPGGVVVHLYSVPTGRLLLVRNLHPSGRTDLAGTLDVDAVSARLLAGEHGVCLVSYDGDTGERDTFGLRPGLLPPSR